MSADLAIYLLWLFWVLSWAAAAPWSAPVQKRAGWKRELPSRLVILSGAVLLFGLYSPRSLGLMRLWQTAGIRGWIFAALAAAGFAFTWWARIHLGRFWSSSVARKDEHRLIDGGPYAMVRHPIYTGIILAVIATAAEIGTVVAVAGALFMIAGFYLKARLEEEFLRAELGAGAYDHYAEKTAMLVPFARL